SPAGSSRSAPTRCRCSRSTPSWAARSTSTPPARSTNACPCSRATRPPRLSAARGHGCEPPAKKSDLRGGKQGGVGGYLALNVGGVLAAVLLAVVAVFVLLSVRRWLLERRGGTVECSLREPDGRGVWRLGIGRYSGDEL